MDGDSTGGRVTAVVVEKNSLVDSATKSSPKQCLEASTPRTSMHEVYARGNCGRKSEVPDIPQGKESTPEANSGRASIKNILHRRKGVTSMVSLELVVTQMLELGYVRIPRYCRREAPA